MHTPFCTKLTRALPWFNKGVWAVVDQGLFAGSNFLLQVLLARWLPPKEYGAFTVAFTVFLLVGTAHTGLLVEPMLVFGPSRHRHHLADYMAVLVRGHAGFALIAAVCLAISAFCVRAFGSPMLGKVLLVLAVAQPFILFSWLVRRSFYVELVPQWAAVAGFIYAALMVAGLYVMYRASLLSVSWALTMMSIASLAAGAWVLFRLKANPLARPEKTLVSESLGQHMRFGRWAVPAKVIEWIPGQLPFLVLPIVAGLEAPAGLKTIRILAMPAAHTYAALSILFMPAFVHARMKNRLGQFVVTALLVVTAAMGCYWALLVLFGAPAMRFLYGGQYGEYAKYVPLLWLVGSQPLVASIASVLSAALKALERPQYVFWANIGTSLGVLSLGIAMIAYAGVKGAILAYTVCNLIGICLMVYLLLRSRTDGSPSFPSQENASA